MKKILHLPFLLFLVVLSSCGDDNGGLSGDNVLHYDGDNFTAPTFVSGVHRFGIRFSSVIANNYKDRTIESVAFYLYDVPTETRLSLSTDQLGTAPDIVISSQVLTGLTPNAWNTVTLDTPFQINGDAFWIDLQVRLPEQMQSIGCDEGPANPNGDWFFNNIDLWQRFSVVRNESVNWNIRAILD